VKHTIQLIDTGSYKTGMFEVEGLNEALFELVQPLNTALKSKMYWQDDEQLFSPVEYECRDGFIPHSDNCGGLQFHGTIPECEKYDFDFISFGEHDNDCKIGENECSCGTDESLLDAALRIWIKFEGIQDDGTLHFYLVCAGGNGDAPYFRTRSEETYFEASFSTKSVDDVVRVGSTHVSKLLKLIGGVA
jgi:hypothetical protein